MGTTKTDTTTGQFDPTGMAAYKGIAGGLGQTLPGFMTNPFGSPQFGLEQQMGTQQAGRINQSTIDTLLRNMTSGNMIGGASSPAGQEMLQNQARAGSGLQAQLGFLAPYLQALQRQQYAMGLGAGYRPLQTGQTQQEKTSGTGTWLPQVAQLALGAAGAPFTGGMSLIGPMMSQMGHMGQGANTGGWSGMGSGSSIQPSMYSAPDQLQGPGGGLPPWFGGS